MVLNNVKILSHNNLTNIHVVGEKIAFITPTPISKALDLTQITFKDAFVFPGLINSHDHLDFNLFPQLGNRIYPNYTAWGYDIHITDKEIISSVLKIPQELRIQWGIYKNLLNGITTVVNHGEPLNTTTNLITVFQNCYSLHSTGFEKNWRWKINLPGKNLPVVIHTGEGTDEISHKEIGELIKWNILKKRLIGIHGVAMSEKQSESFHALVWCPASNYFLFNKTAPVDRFKTKIIFGTDSTLTASWNLWQHLRLARESKLADDKELFDMLTLSAAQVWDLKNTGEIKENYTADLVIAKNKGHGTNMDNFYVLDPEDILMVVHNGNIRMFDAEIYEQLESSAFNFNNFSKIYINGICKYLEGDLPGLIEEIKLYYSEVNLPVTNFIANDEYINQ